MNDVNSMTKQELYQVKDREHFNTDIGLFDSLIILPGKSKDLHDSGYRVMDFVAVKNNKPICKLSGCSDVIHIDGLRRLKNIDKLNKSWNIDCLPKSGLLRLFCFDCDLKAGDALSSFDIIAILKQA